MENKHAIWIEDLLGEVKQNPCEENISLIESCGRACAIHRGDIEGIKELRKGAVECKSDADYINFLKDVLPLDIVEIEGGFTMVFGKTECTCELASEIENNAEALCYCTQGHEKALWSAFFGKPVEVEMIETILRGGNDCIIKILIP